MNNPKDEALGAISSSIAGNIRDLRKLSGLTQAELGARVRLDPTAVAKIETRKRNVSAEEIWLFAAALEVSVETLFDYPGKEDDGLLMSLVLAPERELQNQLREIRQFVSAGGDGTLTDATTRIIAGVRDYSAAVSNPPSSTASPTLIERALQDAERIDHRSETLRLELIAALDKFDTPLSTRATSGETRAQLRNNARTVRNRG